MTITPAYAQSDIKTVVETWKTQTMSHEINRWYIYKDQLKNRPGYENWLIAWNTYRNAQYAIIDDYAQTVETMYADVIRTPIEKQSPIDMTDVETHANYYEECLVTELLRLEEAWRVWSKLTNKDE